MNESFGKMLVLRWVGLVYFLIVFLWGVENSQILLYKFRENERWCGSDDYTNAIAWIPNLRKNNPIEFESDKNMVAMDLDHSWVALVSYKVFTGPIYDYAWEVAPIIQTRDVTKNYNKQFVYSFLGYQNTFGNIEINISILSDNQCHLFMCNRHSIFNSECYWFIFGGWNGQRSVVRFCPQGEYAVYFGKYPKCADLCAVAFNPLSLTEWRHISIRYVDTESFFTVLVNGKEFIKCNQMPSPLREHNNFFVHSYDTNALWKLQQYSLFLAQNENGNELVKALGKAIEMDADTCISFFAQHDNEIVVGLRLSEYTTQEAAAVTFRKAFRSANRRDEWNFYVFHVPQLQRNTYDLQLWTRDRSVTIRNIAKHRNCANGKPGFRFSRLSGVQATCTSLKNNATQLRPMDVDNSAIGHCKSSDETTDFCIRPSDIVPFGIAERVSHICDSRHCYCMPGLTSAKCDLECPRGKYGQNCASVCGFCSDASKCNKANGSCATGCQHNFEEVTCTKPRLPIFTGEILHVQPNCTTTCEIGLRMIYEGIMEPDRYYIEIESSDKFITTRQQAINEDIITLSNLQKSTHYDIRVILCSGNFGCYSYKDNLKRLSLQTSCGLFTEQQFNLTAKDNCIRMQIEGFDAEVQCATNEYTIQFDGNQQQRLTLYDSCLGGAKQYDTVYDFALLHNGTEFIRKFIRTEEGKPYAVRDITAIIRNKNNVHLLWQEPSPSVGRITEYLIEWKMTQKLGCIEQHAATPEETVRTQQLQHTLENLAFHAAYSIILSAFTIKGKGQTSEVKIQTEYADNIDTNNLDVITNRIGANEVQIEFTIHTCTLWNGPIFVLATSSCESEWCKAKNERSQFELTWNRNTTTIGHLVPYSRHLLEIYLQRSKQLLGTDGILFKKIAFTTGTSKPNQISFCDAYSKSKETISVRWSQPYPPTGILDAFYITYDYYSTWSSNKQSLYIYPNTTCDIWPEMLCTTLPVYAGYSYTFYILARNENPRDWSTECRITTLSTFTKPEVTPFVNATWTELHYLTLTWQHPNRTNGQFKHFRIHYMETSSTSVIAYDFFPNRLTLLYQLQTNWSCSPENHNMSIRITTINSNGDTSASAFTTFVCPIFKPYFETDPEVLDMTRSNATLNLSAVAFAEQECNVYIYISHQTENAECTDENFRAHVDNEFGCILLSSQNCRVALTRPLFTSWYHIIGDAVELDDLKLVVLIVNEFQGQTEAKDYILTSAMIDKNKEQDAAIAVAKLWIILIASASTFAIAIIAGYFVYQRTTVCNIFFTPDMQSSRSQERMLLTAVPAAPILVPNSAVCVVDNIKSVRKPQVPKKITKCALPSSKVIPVAELSDYLKIAIFNGEVQQQHESFAKGVQKPIVVGSLPENKKKNRYKNLTAYDHSRVILQPHPNRSSDYINANYIKSPFAKKAYIASQGPLNTTVTDFWHMIIEEGVETIVMLANVIENGKTKVEKYWPDVHKMKKTLICDDVSITAEEVFTHSQFEVRTFKVCRSNSARKVTQYHFTAWPDHGVPMYPQSLIPFMMKLVAIPHCDEHPILVHCSAGVGRTGTIILIDICIRQAKQEQAFDAYYQLHLLREQRPNMVDNVEQYKLAHMVILEYLTMPNTVYACEKLELIVAQLSELAYIEQMQYCADTMWQESAIVPDRLDAVQVVKEKTRDVNIVPEAHGCLYLRPMREGDSTYINAVYVDGFNAPRKFISTQHPLASTVDDFWRLVLDMDITLIVSLQTEYDVLFWRAEDDFTTASGILISHIDMLSEENCQVHTVEVTRNQRTIEVKLVEVDGWALGETVPQHVNLMGPWRVVDKTHNERATLVMCRDGASACGLFIAMCHLLERIKSEQICDVCQCVRHIRRSRKQFITDIAQFKYLYRLALVYLSEFYCYANFKAQP